MFSLFMLNTLMNDNYGLGRNYTPDDRDNKFLMSAALPPVAMPTTGSKYWYNRGILDQGRSSSCVGHAWENMMTSSPVRQFDLDPYEIYNAAQKVDQWPGENYDGTSVRGGAIVLRSQGKLKEYRWAFNLEDTVNWLYNRGPVVIGTWWHDDMFRPDANGFLNPTGGKSGGHAYILQGVNFKSKKVRMVNSWGSSWGQNGRAWMSFDVLESLILDQGEVCTAVE